MTGAAERRLLLSRTFGSYKAEWLDEDLYRLFVQPEYFPELLTPRPCVIVGGRGTGKTTVLRGLSFEGQYELRGRPDDFLERSQYIGLYMKVDANRVRSFRGSELGEDSWRRLFAHYINLQLCLLALDFVVWAERDLGVASLLSDDDLDDFAAATHLSDVPTDLSDCRRKVRRSILELEASINNDPSAHRANISMQGAPVDLLYAALTRDGPLSGKTFFICIDEYETYLDYQQEVLNTLLKGAKPNLTYKIGVRELGWTTRTILDGNEPLISPADYVRIDLGQRWAGREFEAFARAVAQARLGRYAALVAGELAPDETPEAPDVTALLPSLSASEEAKRLGAERIASTFRENLEHRPDLQEAISGIGHLEMTVLDYWRQAQEWTYERTAEDFANNPKSWETRYVNYSYSALFTIRQRRTGIRKYYSGWSTFLHLAAGNIRYALELVEQSFLQSIGDATVALPVVAAEEQTRAAIAVGEKNLTELEQVDEFGSDLIRIVLGLGRVFQMMATYPHGHTPEVNQFYLGTGVLEPATELAADDAARLQSVLTAAVRHLALLRSPGTKPTDEASTRADDYMLHPVYAAFFQYSYRRKRKMRVEPLDLLGLLDDPRDTIRGILRRTRKDVDLELLEDVPEQLALFESYYDAAD